MSKRYREYGLALALLACAGLLAAVLLGEWAHYRAKKADMKKRLAAPVEIHLQAPPPEEAHDGLPGLDNYTVTVERPLFMEGRRPAEADAKAPEAAPAQHLPLTAKLMGIVLAPGQATGLFVDAQGKYKRLRQNDSLGDWKVAELHADKAIMEQDGNREELKLLKAKPKRPRAQQLPPGVPPPAGPFPGQPPPPPPFGAPPPVNPDEPPIEPEPPIPNPNDAVDETIAPPEDPTQEFPNGQ
jgi:hypothetical protein